MRRCRSAVPVAVLAALAGALLLPGTATAAPDRTGQVLVVGVPGLRWGDVDADRTPALWALASGGSVGSLSVRAALSRTCPGDGWATLGAGNRARGPERDPASTLPCAPETTATAITVRPDGSGHFGEQRDLAADNRKLGFDALPGAMADALRCTTTVGAAAAPAGARSSGQLDRYLPALPRDPAEVLRACPVTVVAAPAIPVEDPDAVPLVTPAERHAALRAADTLVARVVAARADDSLLLVVGSGDVAGPPRLHVAIADGPGYGHGWLGSPSTRRAGFVQLIDVAPTVLAAVGAVPPQSVVGRPMQRVEPRGGDLARAVAGMGDDNRAAAAQRPLVQSFFQLVVVLGLALFAAAAVSFRKAWRRTAGPRSPRAGFGRHGRTVELLALGAAAAAPATLVAQLVPWWRTSFSGLVVLAVVAAVAAAVVACAVRGPWRASAVGPIGVVAAFGALVLGLDVLTGSHLQFGALPGYSPLVAGRFTGFGNITFAMFATCVLVAAGCLAQSLPRERRPFLMGAVGAAAVVLVGAPSWGSDVGGLIALAGAVVVATMRSADIRLSFGRVVAAVLVGSLAVVAFAAYDVSRPPSERTHLARFVEQIQDGTASTVVARKAEANLTLLVSSPLTLLVLGAIVLLVFVLLRPVGGLRRVFALYPGVRAGFVGATVASVVGFAVNDSGIAVPAFAAAIGVPLAIAVALRVAAAHGRPGERARKPAAALYAPHDTAVDGTAPDGTALVTAPGGTDPDGNGPPGVRESVAEQAP
ncbi:MAG TPA: hypothetical protein VGP02_15240 [Mycobacteriales bacterium]|nr:hypothetical protein [Mycobacteriales bacterium]